MGGLTTQKINRTNPGKLKKINSCEPFWICQLLISKANMAQVHSVGSDWLCWLAGKFKKAPMIWIFQFFKTTTIHLGEKHWEIFSLIFWLITGVMYQGCHKLEGWGGVSPPVFGQTVNPISTRCRGGADYAHNSTTRPPLDFQTLRWP